MSSSSLLDEFLAASPSADPEFARIRRHHYDPEGKWISLPLSAEVSVRWSRGITRISRLSLRSLQPAFGWENRALDGVLPIDDAIAEKICAGLRARADWEVAELTLLRTEEAAALRAAASRCGFATREAEFPVRVLPNREGYAAFLRTRASSTNKAHRHTANAIQRAGVTLRTDLAWEEVERVFRAKTLRGGSGEDYTKTREFLAFYRDFRARMRELGRLHELGAEREGVIIGFESGFWSGRVLHGYQTGYDPKFAKLRPGAWLAEKQTEIAFEANASMINLMGDYPHFNCYGGECLPLRRLMFFSRSLKARAVAAALELKARIRG